MTACSATPSNRTSLVAGGLLILVAVVAFLWPATEGEDTPGGASSAAAQSASPAVRGPRRHDRQRTLHWSATGRQAIHLTGAEATVVADDAIGPLEGRVVSSTTGAGIPKAHLSFSSGGELHAVTAGGDGAFRFAPAREGVYELAVVSAEGFLAFAPEWGHSPIVFAALRGRGIQGATVSLTPAVTYEGQVLSPTDEPVAGALVALLGAGPPDRMLAALQRHYRTDEQGQFRFNAPDQAIFEARKEPFAPGRARVDFSVQVSHRLTIRLGPPGTGAERTAFLAGRVVGPDGAGVPDALVVARFEPPVAAAPAARLNAGGRALADETGGFSIPGLELGAYTVMASSPGYAAATLRGVKAPADGLELSLTGGGTLAGAVTDAASGAPVPAFTVVVTRAVGALTEEVVTVESTFDPEGRYDVPALPSGSYGVTVSAQGFATPTDRQVAISEGQRSTADFALSAGGIIAGQVLDEESAEPLTGARVSLESSVGQGDESVPIRIAATTGDDGRFELRGVSPGERSLLVAAAGHHGKIVGRLLVRDGERTGPIEVKLAPTGPDEEPRIELAGIGAVLSAEGETLVIGRLVDEGGAAEAGLVVGDAIVAVDGVRVIDLGFAGAIDRIRGPEGTTVTLTVRRAASGEDQSIVVVRRRIRA